MSSAAKLPPPALLEVCLRKAGLENLKADFVKIHTWVAAELLSSASSTYSTSSSSSSRDNKNDPKNKNATSVAQGAEILASALLLHRILIMLAQPQTAMHVVTDVIQSIRASVMLKNNNANAAAAAAVDWSIRSSLDQLLEMLSRQEDETAAKKATANVSSATSAVAVCADKKFDALVAFFASAKSSPAALLRDARGRLEDVRAAVQASQQVYRDFVRIFAKAMGVNNNNDNLASSSVAMEAAVPGDVENDGDATSARVEGAADTAATVTAVPTTATDYVYVQQKRVLDVCWKLALTAAAAHCATEQTPDNHRTTSLLCSATAVACVAALRRSNSNNNKRAKAAGATTGDDGAAGAAAVREEEQQEGIYSSDAVLDAVLAVTNDILKGTGVVVTAEQLGTEVINMANSIKAATEERKVSLAPIVVNNKKRTAEPATLTFLQELLGVATAEKLTWYLPTVSDVLYRRALAANNDTKSPSYIDQTLLTFPETADFLGAVVEPPDVQAVCAEALTPDKLAAAAAAVSTHNVSRPRSVTPIVITEGMELNEWAVSVSFLEVVKPCSALLAMLDEFGNGTGWRDVVLGVVNKALLRLSQEHVTERTTRKAPVTVVTEPTRGVVQVHGELTPDKQLCKAVVAFYYHALEAVLYTEKVRLGADTANKKKIAKTLHAVVVKESFHRALLACCCSCVTKAIGFSQKLNPSPYLRNLQIYSILHITCSSPYEFLKVSETFLRSLTMDTAKGNLGSPLIFGLPRMLRKDIQQVEVNIIDSLLWARNSAVSADSLTDKIIDFQDKMAAKQNTGVCLWPPLVLAPTLLEELEDAGVDEFVPPTYPGPDCEEYAEFRSMSYILRKLLQLAHGRIIALCKYLQVPPEYPVASQVWATFRYLVRNHIELLFDRHVDHWILCALYGVTRTVKYEPELKFAKIIESYVAVREPELGSVTCQRIVRHIKITAGKTTEDSMGNVITLYNKVFVPAMKEHLLNSKSLKSCTAKLAKLQSGEVTAAPAAPEPGLHVQMGGPPAGAPLGARIDFGKADSGTVAQANEFSSAPEDGHT